MSHALVTSTSLRNETYKHLTLATLLLLNWRRKRIGCHPITIRRQLFYYYKINPHKSIFQSRNSGDESGLHKRAEVEKDKLHLTMLCSLMCQPSSENIEVFGCIIKHSSVHHHDNFRPFNPHPCPISMGMSKHRSHNSCWMNGASVASVGIAETG